MPGDWAGFLGAQVAAFAALAGLVFVALSINLKRILEEPGLPGRAGEALIILVVPVATGLASLLPRQSLQALGVEILLIAAIAWAVVTAIILSCREALRRRTRFERVARILIAEVPTGLLLAAGALLAAGLETGFYWQAAAAGACLIAGLADAWVLLIEILR